jgi:hypothetical protein
MISARGWGIRGKAQAVLKKTSRKAMKGRKNFFL